MTHRLELPYVTSAKFPVRASSRCGDQENAARTWGPGSVIGEFAGVPDHGQHQPCGSASRAAAAVSRLVACTAQPPAVVREPRRFRAEARQPPGPAGPRSMPAPPGVPTGGRRLWCVPGLQPLDVGFAVLRNEVVPRCASQSAATPAVCATAYEVPKLRSTQYSGPFGPFLAWAAWTLSPGALTSTLGPCEDPTHGLSWMFVAATATTSS